MVRRISSSSITSKLRQIQAKQKQAINRYNQAVRQHNQQVRQRIQKVNSAINRYNSAVRNYNQRVRADQQRLRQEIARMRTNSTPKFSSYRQSVVRLTTTYSRLEVASHGEALSADENYLLDLSEREAANSVSLLNALNGDDRREGVSDQGAGLQVSTITDEISTISEELNSRWQGALFSLDPRNPEAARHFCTSVREIFTGVLERSAPDNVVAEALADCTFTEQGRVTRRSKMVYLLERKGISNDELADFTDENVGNIVELFKELNGATHGPSGKMSVDVLREIKRRVEDGLLFLCQIAA